MRRGQLMPRWSAICIGIGWSVLAAMAATPAEDLDKAGELFRKGQYTDARELLMGIDRDKLTDEQKVRRDELANELEEAINQAGRARQNLEDADAAFKSQDLGKAERLFRAVQANLYATDAQKQRARDGLALIEKQRQLETRIGESTPPATRPARGPRAPATRPAAVSNAKAQRDRVEADRLIREGDEAMARAQYDTAQDRYQAALKLVPGHADALKGLELLRQHRAVEGQPPGIATLEVRRRQRWDRAEVLLRSAENEVRAAINKANFDEARTRLTVAQQTLEGARRDAQPPDRYTYWHSQLSALGRRIEAEQREFEQDQARQKAREARIRENQRQAADFRERTERVTQLMQQAAQLRKEYQYEKALDVVKEVLTIDPLNARAQDLKEYLQDLSVINRQKQRAKFGADQFQGFREHASDALVADVTGDDRIIKYPSEEDWRIVVQRDPFGAGISGESAADAATRQKLAKVIPAVDFPEGTGFAEVVDFLRIQAQVSIDVNWPALALAGVERTTDTGGLQLRDVKIEIALQRLLENVTAAAGGTTRIGYDIVDGVVVISTQDDLNSKTVLRVYVISDLLLRIRSFRDPNAQN
ncbi:MAG: hypothetical protein HRF43_11450, partial [Phycisphaerae bacterium]